MERLSPHRHLASGSTDQGGVGDGEKFTPLSVLAVDWLPLCWPRSELGDQIGSQRLRRPAPAIDDWTLWPTHHRQRQTQRPTPGASHRSRRVERSRSGGPVTVAGVFARCCTQAIDVRSRERADRFGDLHRTSSRPVLSPADRTDDLSVVQRWLAVFARRRPAEVALTLAADALCQTPRGGSRPRAANDEAPLWWPPRGAGATE